MVMQFPANTNAKCPKAPCDFPPRLSPPPERLPWDSPHTRPKSVRTGGQAYADVRTKVSQINRLQDLLTHGAPAIKRSSAIATFKSNLIFAFFFGCNLG